MGAKSDFSTPEITRRARTLKLVPGKLFVIRPEMLIASCKCVFVRAGARCKGTNGLLRLELALTEPLRWVAGADVAVLKLPIFVREIRCLKNFPNGIGFFLEHEFFICEAV